MESHILNMYHQAPYRSIGHKILRSISESLSSEGSCNQNSPEYSQSQQANQFEDENEEYWDQNNQVWSQNQNVNITQSNQDTSVDEDENIEVQEVSLDDKSSDSNDHVDLLEADTMEENSLVEGDDYDIIQVFAVDPDLDLEASSDEEQDDYCIPEDSNSSNSSDEGEYLNSNDKSIRNESRSSNRRDSQSNSISQDSLGINFDAPVVSNVDEYFIKQNDEKHILEVKDEPIVRDVDEYFIKDTKESTPSPPPPTNVEELFVKSKLPETDFRISKTVPDEIFEPVEPEPPVEVKEQANEEVQEDPVADVSINESDLEVLPNIEELKRYLLDDLPYTKLKNAQKSYSVSLPHSPMHNICMDIDAKTCLSFEDLNLDLSDLTFDNDKEKSSTSLKSDDIPRTLTEEDVNSFLITNQTEMKVVKTEDDFCPQDMDIDRPIDSIISNGDISAILPDRKCTSTPIPKPNVLEFCIEKIVVKKEPDIKVETDDFVDVESCNDAVIPVLEANNLNSLLEQFEATEKLNKHRKPTVNTSDSKTKSFSVTSGMRLQDAGVQLNKTKMRQILMPSPVNTVIRRSPSPVHSDHDYCSSKKRHSLPNLKGGQSLLKPEVLSSNNKILNSRHRSCKNKKVVYHLSSDDESDANLKKKNKILNNRSSDDSDIKTNKKTNIKLTVKAAVNSNHRRKLSPPHSALNDCDVDKSNGSVMVKNAFKASDTSCSQNCNGSLKLTIKNKSEVIIKNCDVKDNHKDSVIDKNKNSVLGISANKLLNNMNNSNKGLDTLDRNKMKDLNSVEKPINISTKHEVNSKEEHFYTALFSNKQDVQLPQSIKTENKIDDEQIKTIVEPIIDIEQPQKKKKLNLQEYKLRRTVSSNASSAQVSPEAIFPDMPCNLNLDKNFKVISSQAPASGAAIPPKEQINTEASKAIFDPIREASRKILMNSKKQKAEAIRKRDEDFVMSKIPKVENLELQPLISDAEMMKIVGMTAEVMTIPIAAPNPTVDDKAPQPKEYDEIVLVSVGTNTDENMFKQTEKVVESKKRKSTSPRNENKATINFKIKKSDHVLKQNVFDSVKRSKSPADEKNHSDVKIDKERLKDITATLKSVEKQVDTKISSNSLFASIQDVVKKNAPPTTVSNGDHKSPKHTSVEKREAYKYIKTSIVRQYDTNTDHGEDKIILHLEKNRKKPDHCHIVIQTDSFSENGNVAKENEKELKENSPLSRKRNDSDMSMSSEDSPVRGKKTQNMSPPKVEEKVSPSKSRQHRRELPRSQSKENRSRSRERYDVKYRRSRSHSRGHRRKRSHSRNRSRSRGRFRCYRRSDSPYRRKRRSRTRSPYRSTRRSPSIRRDYRSTRTRSRSKHADVHKSRSPVPKKRMSPQYNVPEKKIAKSLTPPPRKPTVSESSDSTTSSSSSSSSASSASSKSRRSCSPYKKEENYRNNYRSSFSSEDRESNTPVEERRIVFVGRLEKDLSKVALRAQFTKFGPVTEVRLHSKEDGSRYGFVTFQRPRDAWSAVEAAGTFPQYDVGFGGRRAFCRQSYADLDGLEAKYTESAFHGQAAMPIRRNDDMSFEQMLLDIKKKLNKRKGDKNRQDDTA